MSLVWAAGIVNWELSNWKLITQNNTNSTEELFVDFHS